MLPAVLVLMLERGWVSSHGSESCKSILLPISQAPVLPSNLNAEQPLVDMHKVVQCSSELEMRKTSSCKDMFVFKWEVEITYALVNLAFGKYIH